VKELLKWQLKKGELDMDTWSNESEMVGFVVCLSLAVNIERFYK